MRIDALDVYYLKNQLLKPWVTAYGKDDATYTIMVRMTSGSETAWSEASPLMAPMYSPEFAQGVYIVVTQFLAPMIVGRSFDSAVEINEAMSAIKGNPFAKSAIEIAWWTLESKRRGVPLHVLLGGSDQEVATGADFGIQESIDTLLALIDEAIKEGYPRIKLKAKPGWDLNMLQAVRSTFPDFTFHIDCNSGYSLADLELFRQIDRFHLAMIEQPLFHADVRDHAKLQASIETPICLDESITSVRVAREAIELGACKFINIKPGRVGGLLPALQINTICREAGIGCWVGGMLETAIGVGICIELATIGNMVYPSDLLPSSFFYEEELSLDRIVHSGPGRMKPSSKPGNGYVPDPQRLQARTLATIHLGG
ncbi:MAG: o-succinylbenzoate synthase [Bacillota bacterium]|nr:o-succinylbenzoate synthase [Bacillota bacterium]